MIAARLRQAAWSRFDVHFRDTLWGAPARSPLPGSGHWSCWADRLNIRGRPVLAPVSPSNHSRSNEGRAIGQAHAGGICLM